MTVPETQPNNPSSPAPHPWSFQIAVVAGIPIRIHFTFVLALLWLVGLVHGGSFVLRLAFVLLLFTCVLLHELGHSLVARRYNIPVADITLYPIGGVARIEKRPEPKQEFWIAVAGPAVNVVIAAILLGILSVVAPRLDYAHPPTTGVNAVLVMLMLSNIVLVLFNLIPAFPMDGGRVLRAVLAMTINEQRATEIAAMIGQLIAILFGIAGIMLPSWQLLFIAFFVFIGAGQEVYAYRTARVLEGVTVKQAMMTDVKTLAVGATLREAADVLLATSQHDFPVVHGEEVLGVLTRNGLLRALAAEGPGGYVAGAMDRSFESAGPDDDLTEMLPRLQEESRPLVVLGSAPERRLLGMVTGDNLAEFFALRQIIGAQGGGPYAAH